MGTDDLSTRSSTWMCLVACRQGCRQTAAWSSSMRRATRRYCGSVRRSGCRRGGWRSCARSGVPPRPRIDPALDGGSRCLSRVRAEACRDMADLLRLGAMALTPSAGLQWSRSRTLTHCWTAHTGVMLLHQARSGQQLSPAAGTGFGQVEDEFSLAAGPAGPRQGRARR